jgi:hypothetical protein
VLNTITGALAAFRRVELGNLGVFAVRRRKAHSLRNRHTGAVVAVAERAAARFPAKWSGVLCVFLEKNVRFRARISIGKVVRLERGGLRLAEVGRGREAAGDGPMLLRNREEAAKAA